MKKYTDYKFGLLFGDERKGVYLSIIRLSQDFDTINIAEIGYNEGKTGKAIRDISKDFGLNFNYYGIDIRKHKKEITSNEDKVSYIRGDANDESIAKLIPDNINFLFIDSCHCEFCVKRQYDLYSKKLVRGGIILFHDYAKEFQGVLLTEPHDKSKNKRCKVRKVVKKLKLLKNGYELFFVCEEGNGLIAYRKVG